MTDKVLKFSASWCGPCKALAMMLKDQDIGVPVEDVDIDANTELAVKYNIRSVPTMVYVKGGTESSRMAGAQASLDFIRKWVDNNK